MPDIISNAMPGLFGLLREVVRFNRGMTTGILAVIGVLFGAAALYSYITAPPKTLTISSGPPGSIFHTNAVKYAAELARYGVKLKVLNSRGSLENLERLSDPKIRVDVGFVQGGVTNSAADGLVSLGSVSYQALMLFYRGEPIDVLSGLVGKRVVAGAAGSGTRNLALTLLATNGITPGGPTEILDWEPKAAYEGLLGGKVDAAFLMGEDASPEVLRGLLRSTNVHLFSFKQTHAYNRKFTYLSELVLPEGGIDLGRDIPREDVHLLGPTIELIARPKLHPALSDLLLEAAKAVHGRATLYQHKGEFPAPLEHDFPISTDAARYYKSGKTFFYRHLPFWLASLASQIVLVFVPTIIVVVPVARSIPKIYFWRLRMRIYRRYRLLLAIERELLGGADSSRYPHLLKRLDEMEEAVSKMRVPGSVAELCFNFRGHIDFVRNLIYQRQPK